MKAKQKKLAFGGGLAIYITVMLTVLFVALAFWWHLLACYEADRIEGTMDAYMTKQLTAQLQTEMGTYSIASQTGYQSADEVFAILSETLSGDEWSYQLNRKKTTNGHTVYNLCCGDLVVGEAVVQPGGYQPENLGYGTWKEPEATFDLAQFGYTVTVTAPYGCEVFINGVLVDDDNVTETIGLYPQLEEYETLITEPNQLLVYHIDNTFVDVAVEFSQGYTKIRDEETGIYYALPICEDTLAEEQIQYCKDFVQAHTEYVHNKVALWAVQQYVVPDSALYEELTALSGDMKWGHGINAEIVTLDVKNFNYYGNVITCEASYSMTTDEGDRTETMEILLVNTVLGWRVMHREIV